MEQRRVGNLAVGRSDNRDWEFVSYEGLEHPFDGVAVTHCGDYAEEDVEARCLEFIRRHTLCATPAATERLLSATRPGLAGLLNCAPGACQEHVQIFADIYVWYVAVDDFLEPMQQEHCQWDDFVHYDWFLARMAFDSFGFSIRAPGQLSRHPTVQGNKSRLSQARRLCGALREILSRVAPFCVCDLQYLDLCRAIEGYTGANAFESLQYSDWAVTSKEEGLMRYSEMRGESIGQAISMELALIFNRVYVPRHIRNTAAFKRLWDRGTEFVWKANDLIGSAKDWAAHCATNAVCLLGRKCGHSLAQAQRAYTADVLLPAVRRFREVLEPHALEGAMRAELITAEEERRILFLARRWIAHICWASYAWNCTVQRYSLDRAPLSSDVFGLRQEGTASELGGIHLSSR
jgi:hypothetical protein